MKYFVKLVGKAFGPLEEEKIVEMYHAGRLKDPVEISRDKKTWESIDIVLSQSVPDLPPSIPSNDPDLDSPSLNLDVIEPAFYDPNSPIWYYSADGSNGYGPVTKSDLKTMLECGMLNSRSLVWQKGENSRPISIVPELSDLFNSGLSQSSLAGTGGGFGAMSSFSSTSGNPFQGAASPFSNDSRLNSTANMFDLLDDPNFGNDGSGQGRAPNNFQLGQTNRSVYLLLALLLGQLGVHNFYAKRMDIAIVQLFIGLTNLVGIIVILFVSLATQGEGQFLLIIPAIIGLGLQIWAIVEMCTVTNDGTGKRMY